MEKIILKLLINKEAIVLFFIVIFIIFIVIIIWNSKLQVKIYNLDISTIRKEKIKKDFDIRLGILIFNKIEIFNISIKKLENKSINLGTVLEKAKNFEEKRNKQISFKEFIKSLKNFKFEIQEADLKLELGTEDAAITAIIIGVVSSILGIILKEQKFQIIPIYEDKNILNIKLNCIFRINLIHYIYKNIMKGRDKNERKPSYRRSYAYSNE